MPLQSDGADFSVADGLVGKRLCKAPYFNDALLFSAQLFAGKPLGTTFGKDNVAPMDAAYIRAWLSAAPRQWPVRALNGSMWIEKAGVQHSVIKARNTNLP